MFQSAKCCYLTFLGTNKFCVVVATILMCITHYSNLDNIIHNNNCTHRKKRQRVLRKDTEEKIAKTYYRMLTWIINLVKTDKEFPARLREWQTHCFKGSPRQYKDPGNGPNRVETVPAEHRTQRHTGGEAPDPELALFQTEANFDFFSNNPLGFDSRDVANSTGV